MTTNSARPRPSNKKDFERNSFGGSPNTSNDKQPSSHELQALQNAKHVETTIKPTWRSLFAFTTREHWLSLMLGSLSAIAAGLMKPAISIFFGKIFAIITSFGGGGLSSQEALHQVSIWCIALTALGIVAWLTEGGLMTGWVIFGELQARRARQELFATILDRDMEWYDSREDGMSAFLIRLQTQIRELQLGTSQPLGMLLLQVISGVSSLAVALYFSWNLSLVIMATFPIAGLVLWFVSRELTPAIEAQKRELGRATKLANTAVTAIDTVKVFNAQDQEIWQYYSTIKKVTTQYLKQARANALQFGVIKFLLISIFVQGFWYGLYLVNRGLNPGNVFTTFYSCLSAIQALEVMLPQVLVLTKAMSAGETLKTILKEIKQSDKPLISGGSLDPETCDGDIEMNDVTFAYPSNISQPVLKKASFFFPAGETTFLVGRSGSGKSTIGNILLKYYEHQSGEVLIDGHPIEHLSTNWLRRNITLVQQQSLLFNETIYQNIAFGRRDSPTRREIETASKTAFLEKTLFEMPEGFETVVGSGGRSLSGGQTQRIAIARARLRDTPILILDESTSALDHTSRLEVMQAVREWRRGKTTVIITHEMSQILDTDYVYVLENSHVVQEGYRKKLVSKGYGTFLSILRAENSEDYGADVSTSPKAPVSSLDDARQSKHYNPKLMNRGAISPDVGNFKPGSNRLSIGIGLSQASELKTKNVWQSPTVPQTPVREPSKSPWAFLYLATPKSLSPLELEHKNKQCSSPPIPKTRQPSNFRNFSATFVEGNENDHRLSTTMDPLILPIRGGMNGEPASLKRILGTVWPILTPKQRAVFLLGFFTAFIVAAATPAFAYVFARLLNTFYSPPEDQLNEARQWALILLGIAITDGLASFTTHYSLEYSGQAWISNLRLEALKRILAQPKSWFDMEEHSSSQLNDCLDRNAEEMRNLVGRFAGLVVTVAAMLGISVIWAFVVSWQFTLVSLACGPVMYFATRIFHVVSNTWEDKCNKGADRTASIFTETFANIRLVRALTLENYFGRKHRAANNTNFKLGVRRAAYSGLLFGLLDSGNVFIITLAFYYSTVLITKGTYAVGDMFQVINLLILGLSNASGIISMIPQIGSSCATATKMLYLASLPLHDSDETKGTVRLSTPFPIQMNDLSFTYLGQSLPALGRISLTIEPGRCIAIVGPSGSGKSTIVSLLLGLYPPDPKFYGPAPLTFHNHSISSLNMAGLRRFISVVPQTPLLFPTSVSENIVYGLPENSPFRSLKSAKHAASLAGIHDFIASLPDGYDTAIGEGGQGLSGGQAQRVAIAQALVRKPQVLIMDEATSALDNESAEIIRECVRGLLTRNIAVVMVSHSVDMMRIADHIVVVQDGAVAETGGFEELRQKGGAFSRLIGEATVEVHGLGLGTDKKMSPVNKRTRETWIR